MHNLTITLSIRVLMQPESEGKAEKKMKTKNNIENGDITKRTEIASILLISRGVMAD